MPAATPWSRAIRSIPSAARVRGSLAEAHQRAWITGEKDHVRGNTGEEVFDRPAVKARLRWIVVIRTRVGG